MSGITLPGTGELVATDTVAGEEVQQMKVVVGGDGVGVDVSTAAPFPVNVAEVSATESLQTEADLTKIKGTAISLDNPMPITGLDPMLAIAMGLIPGYSAVNKFGHNPAATAGEDIWGGGGVYGFFPTEAVAMDVVSSDDEDGGAGTDTGALTIQVYGLDNDWLEQNETVTLNGTTPVALANEYIRIFRTIVLTAGSVETNIGNLIIASTEAAGGIAENTVGVYVNAGDGQTQQTIYTIPAGKTGYFIKGYTAMADDDKNGEVAEFQWQARPNNGVNGAWAVKGEVGLNNVGTGTWQYRYGVPAGPLPEKTDIRIRVTGVTATLGVVGGYDIVLVDN
jgi:hypothetical protein